MDFVFPLLLFAGLFGALLIAQEKGFRDMQRAVATSEEATPPSAGPIEAAVFSILGLLLAFSFSVAETRFEHRREIAVEEANNISTALQRSQLLPSNAQTTMNRFFAEYVQVRIDFNQALSGKGDAEASWKRTEELQAEMWKVAMQVPPSASGAPTPVQSLLLPALNSMFDITSTRKVASVARIPLVTQSLLVIISLLSAYLAGKTGGLRRSQAHLTRLIYPLVIALTLMVIFDLDNPRIGIIRVDFADQPLLDLRDELSGPSRY